HDDHDLNPFRLWASADYLLWKLRDQKVPLIDNRIPFRQTGFDEISSRVSLAEGMDLKYPNRSGFRLTAGAWLDSEMTIGGEASYFLVDRFTREGAIQGIAEGQILVVGTSVTPPTPTGNGGFTPAIVTPFNGALATEVETNASAHATSRIWGAE